MRQGNGNSNPFRNGFSGDSYFNADAETGLRNTLGNNNPS
jgi:hypothetical protein